MLGLHDGRWGSIKGGKALQALLSTAAWSAQFSRQWRQRRTTVAGNSLQRDTVGQHASWPLPREYTSSAWFLLPFRSQSVAAVDANFLLGALVLLSPLGDAIADLLKKAVAEGLEAFNSVRGPIVNLSQSFHRGLSNSQSDFISTPCRRLCIPSLCNRHLLQDSNMAVF